VVHLQEILRHEAPASMVPNVALKDVQLTDKVRSAGARTDC
jgi:cytochrome P450